METLYTVSEDVGSVEVCVNLTQPQVDILEEYVVVEVIDFPSSIYIQTDVILASESLKHSRGITFIITLLFSSS